MKKIEAAYEILSESRKLREKFKVTGKQFDKVHANIYSVFECYAHGIIDWDHTKSRLKTALKEYVRLYKNTPHLKEEKAKMLKEYNRLVKEYKPVLDTYRKVSEQKMIKSLLNNGQLNESQAQQQSNIYFNRGLSDLQLNDVALTENWNEVVNTYPNLTNKDQARVRMLTIFEGPTVDTTQMITTIAEEPTAISGPMQTSMRPRLRPRDMEDPGFDFNPNAGHRDQPSHPENRGLTPSRSSSPRPKLRPSGMDQRAAINRAVNQAMGVGEGYKILPPMDREKYQERPGLEGPFSTLSGKVVYYDPKEGSYYDPDTDMYISYDDFRKLDNDYSGMKDERDDVKEAGKRWKQTSMSPEEAIAKYGKENVRVKKGALRNGNDMVEVFVEGHSPHPKGSAKYKKHMAAMHAGMNEEMSDDEVDAFHRALDELVHKYLGHSSDEVDERKMTKKEKSKEKRLKKKYDDSDMKASMKKQYGDDWEQVYFATIRKQAMEGEGKFDGHDIMSEDPPNGIDFDYDNLSKVNWAQYSKEDIDTFYRIIDNLDFESGYYGDIDDFDSSHSRALRWLEGNVLNKTEAKRRPDHNLMARARLQQIMQQAIKDSKRKRGLDDEDEKDRTDEMTSAGGIAAVAQPMGKMQRRKKTNEDDSASNRIHIGHPDDYTDDVWKHEVYINGKLVAAGEHFELDGKTFDSVDEFIVALSQKFNVPAKFDLYALDDNGENPKLNARNFEPRNFTESKKKSPAGGPACWDGKKIHPTKPTKMKGGKRVNNCIDDGK